MADLSQYRLSTDEDFDKLVALADSQTGWNVVYEGSDCKVWDQKSDNSPINLVKLVAPFGIDPWVMYDTLHDPEYRPVWDENMAEGYNICQLNKNNDIGYYSAKSPVFGVSGRDFVNQRYWRVKDATEFIIMNHSVIHPNAPEKKGFVRAKSILTGYMLRKTDTGCTLTYVSQTDPSGSIPTWLWNTVTKKFAPSIVGKLTKAAAGYTDWKSKNKPDHKPWRD